MESLSKAQSSKIGLEIFSNLPEPALIVVLKNFKLTDLDEAKLFDQAINQLSDQVKQIPEIKELIEIRQFLRKFQDNMERTLFEAAKKGNLKVVKYLIDQGVDPTTDDNYAIIWASKNGRTEVVKLLLAIPEVDPTAKHNYAIKWASVNGRTEVVKLLLADQRVNPTAGDNYAIKWASAKGRTKVVKLLLAIPEVDPTANDNFATRWASANGHTEVVRRLLRDYRINLQNPVIQAIIKQYPKFDLNLRFQDLPKIPNPNQLVKLVKDDSPNQQWELTELKRTVWVYPKEGPITTLKDLIESDPPAIEVPFSRFDKLALEDSAEILEYLNDDDSKLTKIVFVNKEDRRTVGSVYWTLAIVVDDDEAYPPE